MEFRFNAQSIFMMTCRGGWTGKSEGRSWRPYKKGSFVSVLDETGPCNSGGANMHQTLAVSGTQNQFSLRSDSVGKPVQWATACIEALRHGAAVLRAQLQVQRLGADTKVSLEDAVHLLQKAAMLERSAEVLAQTSVELR
ncbi:hypothetical protein [Cupriavidus sp. 8B]